VLRYIKQEINNFLLIITVLFLEIKSRVELKRKRKS